MRTFIPLVFLSFFASTLVFLPSVLAKTVPVLAISNGTASVNTSQLVGYWRFEEGSGTTATDSSGIQCVLVGYNFKVNT